MAQFKITTDAVSGLKDRSYFRGQVVDETALPSGAISGLIAGKYIEKVEERLEQIDYSKFTHNELREMFPEIKATSKAKFLEQIK